MLENIDICNYNQFKPITSIVNQFLMILCRRKKISLELIGDMIFRIINHRE